MKKDGKEYLDEMKDFPAFSEQEACQKYCETLDHLDIMQINVGKKCNLHCKHCHVQAGPDRTELMDKETMDACIAVFKNNGFKTIDITGGAPEMNPNTPYLIEKATEAGAHVIVRSNLVILEEPEYAEYLDIYKKYRVELFASLPSYVKRDADRQRGAGTFDAVIDMIKKLNAEGYGVEDGLTLNLVYNPGGAFLPPDQAALGAEYAQKLGSEFGIKFNDLFAITNNPIGRFGDFLKRSGNYPGYMKRLINAFNPAAAENMMCRNQISVDDDGTVYDCDFNLALGLPANVPGNIRDLTDTKLQKRKIVFANHCYACTAGAGSSCGGTTTEE